MSDVEINHEVNVASLDAWTAFKLGAAFAGGCVVVSVAASAIVAGVAIASGVELERPELRG